MDRHTAVDRVRGLMLPEGRASKIVMSQILSGIIDERFICLRRPNPAAFPFPGARWVRITREGDDDFRIYLPESPEEEATAFDIKARGAVEDDMLTALSLDLSSEQQSEITAMQNDPLNRRGMVVDGNTQEEVRW